MRNVFVANVILSSVYLKLIDTTRDLNIALSYMLLDSIDDTNYAEQSGNKDNAGRYTIIEPIEPANDSGHIDLLPSL